MISSPGARKSGKSFSIAGIGKFAPRAWLHLDTYVYTTTHNWSVECEQSKDSENGYINSNPSSIRRHLPCTFKLAQRAWLHILIYNHPQLVEQSKDSENGYINSSPSCICHPLLCTLEVLHP